MVGSAVTEVIVKAARKLDRRSENMSDTMPKEKYDRRSEGNTGDPALVGLSEGRKQASGVIDEDVAGQRGADSEGQWFQSRMLALGESCC